MRLYFYPYTAVLKQEQDMISEDFVTVISPQVELAIERAYVLFNTFGWEYFDGQPSRKRLETTIIGLFETLDDNKDLNATSTGRLMVSRSVEEDYKSYSISLVLGSVYVKEGDDE